MNDDAKYAIDRVRNLCVPMQRVPNDDQHYFFGYYDKCPWDATGRYLLGMRSVFCDRQPGADEPLTIGMFDLHDGARFIELDQTRAWCWQQGTMLQWLGTDSKRLIINNTVDGDRYGSVIRDVIRGDVRRLPRPIYAVSRDGTQAISLDFDRVNRLRPGYGYARLPEKFPDDRAPKSAGVYHMSLADGASRLVVSLKQLADYESDDRMTHDKHHWVNHLEFSPGGSRFLFLHRWACQGQSITTRLYTVRPDGSDLRLILDTQITSHFCWRDEKTILVWARHDRHGERANYLLVDALTGEREAVGQGILTEDGHCTFSPDTQWILTDTYPDADDMRTLILYQVNGDRRFDVGAFYSSPQLVEQYGPIRCDLHPRWDRTGTQVCIDSVHEGIRQMYVLDVSSIVKG